MLEGNWTMINNFGEPVWRKSSRCGNTTCVEVAKVGDEYLIRDSKDLSMAPLRFTQEEWVAFEAGVQAGEFRFQ